MNKERKNLLVFGYGLAVILTVWSLLHWRKYPEAFSPWVLLPLAVVLVIVTRWKLDYLKPVYKYWMKGGHAIGQTVTFLILTLLFYLVFAPVGIILRILRKDLLDRAPEPNAKSYWKPRKGVADRTAYTKQF